MCTEANVYYSAGGGRHTAVSLGDFIKMNLMSQFGVYREGSGRQSFIQRSPQSLTIYLLGRYQCLLALH